MVDKSEIKEHAEVVDNNGNIVGVVDHLEGDHEIKLAKNAPESGGQHHLIPISWVDRIEENQVVLSKSISEVEQNWKAI
ncbi:hypothetical protein W822_05670 [Advenella kashmirensis W13003]|uniref:DUF2171 domain-containing protein n=1 Tax=Advenella kashmirensis W13003 TaxID=1424334 RepID=V8QWA9_9BURK|nr:DUF2171 domain-containing protein [Advenella kashmirensis]ETF03623.1 hypothetical protein W822_05670 [Advenella kashmirensis W13003]